MEAYRWMARWSTLVFAFFSLRDILPWSTTDARYDEGSPLREKQNL